MWSSVPAHDTPERLMNSVDMTYNVSPHTYTQNHLDQFKQTLYYGTIQRIIIHYILFLLNIYLTDINTHRQMYIHMHINIYWVLRLGY